MPAFEHNFSTFIDHYILLLAARFDAPLDAAALCCGDDAEPWEQVAMCVRDMLARPVTAAEKREVAHVDASFFDAGVCRGRALYFKWRLQEEAAAATAVASPHTSAKASTGAQKVKNGASAATTAAVSAVATVPSNFDITRQSLANEVQEIYAAVRASLPSTLGLQQHGDTCGNDDTNEADEDDNDVVDTVDFAFRTEEEEERDRVVADARDAFLTKIQTMQTEFFLKHKRWVDVPFDIADDASAAREEHRQRSRLADAVDSNANALSKSAMREALHAATPQATTPMATEKKVTASAAATASTADCVAPPPTNILEALKWGVHVDRPPRPSQMREEDYQTEYGDVVLHHSSAGGIGAEVDVGIYKGMMKSGVPRLPQQEEEQQEPTRQQQQQQQQQQPQQPQQPQQRSLLNDGLDNGVPLLPARTNRWSVLEYDGDSDEDADNFD
ncbi:hypothetical protein DQ04_02401070 [Trypanosoma grayi]|uniref:hypothetical protein n=1 Tax=Trypanosoma grayi TaxID=71804 RepID=UPI0004F45CEE|nr:hypothetical protein DQ04_02401070 [Trypanosoma grayi]KEG11653.1 hypothetical protein DQ04_02401070 [Trypanosoma grayi]